MKDLVRKTALWAVRSSVWKTTSKWIRGTERWNRLEDEYDGSYAKGEVVVYFGDRSSKFYQLEQWIPVLEELHKKHRVVLVLRKGSSLLQALESTHLPVVFKRRFDPLHTFYHANDFKLALYVNNGVTNFQSLAFAPMVHVHVNHGESDKLSMVSNQAKSYDKVFVAGDAAIERHRQSTHRFRRIGADQDRSPAAGHRQACGARAVISPDDYVRADVGRRERVEQLHLGRPLWPPDRRGSAEDPEHAAYL